MEKEYNEIQLTKNKMELNNRKWKIIRAPRNIKTKSWFNFIKLYKYVDTASEKNNNSQNIKEQHKN